MNRSQTVHVPRRPRLIGAAVAALLVAAGLTFGAQAPMQVASSSSPVGGVVVVDASKPSGATSTFDLVEGTTYVLEVTGSYSYGFRGGVADAECSTLPPDDTFQRNRYLLLDPSSDPLDLLVDGNLVEWQAAKPDAFGCDGTSNRYRLVHVPDRTGPVNFRVHDSGHNDNRGGFEVAIMPTDEILVDTVVVDSAASRGASTAVALEASKHYRLEAVGSYTFGFGSGAADAECARLLAGGPAVRNLLGATSPTDPTSDPLDLLVNGGRVEWQPLAGDALGCDPDHRYELDVPDGTSGQVAFRIDDSNHRDNAGSITVSVFELPSADDPPPLGVPKIVLADTVTVDSSDPDGSTTAAPLTAGESYLVEVSGTYGWGMGRADAECSTRTDTGDTTFRRQRHLTGTDVDASLLDVLVDGTAVEWTPSEADAEQCATGDHTYRLIHVPERTGPARFNVFDLNHRDNGGTLTVRVFVVTEVPVATLEIDSRDADGVTVPLAAGLAHRLEAQGTYYFGAGSALADAECANRSDIGDTAYLPHRFVESGNDLLDLDVGDDPVHWQPVQPNAECDADHRYQVEHVPGGPTTRVVIDDRNHRDNFGVLEVRVFLKTS